MITNLSSDFNFTPEAMLTGWVVTDVNLVVRRMNDLAEDLLANICGRDQGMKESELSLSLKLKPAQISFWDLLFDMEDETTRDCIDDALEMLVQQQAHLRDFQRNNAQVMDLVTSLKDFDKVRSGVTSYCDYHERPAKLQLGVKITPLQGLKLREPLYHQPGTLTFEYLSAVISHQLQIQGQNVVVKGIQTTLHDASERHHLWQALQTQQEKIRREEVERNKRSINRFLSHAFKTPLASLKTYAQHLKATDLSEAERRNLTLRLCGNVDDLNNLVELLFYVSTHEKHETQLTLTRTPWLAEDVSFRGRDIAQKIAEALESVGNHRTGRPIDIDKLNRMCEVSGQAVKDACNHHAISNCRFEELTRGVIQFCNLKEEQTFFLRPVRNEQLSYRENSSRIKTILLDLMLSEMIINAVKNSDEVDPQIRIRLAQKESSLRITVLNNGRGHDSQYGEKRLALGQKLNAQASEQHGWKYQLRRGKDGAVCSLRIPIGRT